MISIKKIGTYILSSFVHFYRRAISPYLHPSCRHYPSCSQYMLDALERHGPVRGTMMGITRILRCRPGGTHGYDPVPKFIIKRYRPIYMFFKKRRYDDRLKEE